MCIKKLGLEHVKSSNPVYVSRGRGDPSRPLTRYPRLLRKISLSCVHSNCRGTERATTAAVVSAKRSAFLRGWRFPHVAILRAACSLLVYLLVAV